MREWYYKNRIFVLLLEGIALSLLIPLFVFGATRLVGFDIKNKHNLENIVQKESYAKSSLELLKDHLNDTATLSKKLTFLKNNNSEVEEISFYQINERVATKIFSTNVNNLGLRKEVGMASDSLIYSDAEGRLVVQLLLEQEGRDILLETTFAKEKKDLSNETVFLLIIDFAIIELLVILIAVLAVKLWAYLYFYNKNVI